MGEGTLYLVRETYKSTLATLFTELHYYRYYAFIKKDLFQCFQSVDAQFLYGFFSYEDESEYDEEDEEEGGKEEDKDEEEGDDDRDEIDGFVREPSIED